ncbi:MAPEG family protein [Phormidesmis sp. 146-12]
MLNEMTAPLWGLVTFILWTIAIAVLLIVVRIRHLATGGSIKDFAIPNDESLLWRLYRVHANLVENLPLYLGVVFLLTVQGTSGTGIDILIWIYIACRMLHSVIHIAGLDPRLRLLSLVIQFSCLIALTTLAVF